MPSRTPKVMQRSGGPGCRRHDWRIRCGGLGEEENGKGRDELMAEEYTWMSFESVRRYFRFRRGSEHRD